MSNRWDDGANFSHGSKKEMRKFDRNKIDRKRDKTRWKRKFRSDQFDNH
jgi:hypothetical protein